jgi:hypothetical protein
MKLKGQLQADIPTADPDFLNANIVLHQFRMADGKQDIAIDSVMVIATATAQRNTIAIKSPILDATVDGKYKLTQIGDAITNSVSRYYDFNPKARKTKTQPQLLAFNAVVKNNPVLFQLLPELKGFEPMVINGRYNSQNDTIILSAAMPKIIYGTNKLTNAIVKIDTKDEALVYNIFIDDLKMHRSTCLMPTFRDRSGTMSWPTLCCSRTSRTKTVTCLPDKCATKTAIPK